MTYFHIGELAKIKDSMLARFAREGDDEALRELISRYELFIKLQSKKLSLSGLDKEDLIQEGMIGLFSAVRTYKEEGGASFHTYAILCIKRSMLSAVRSASRRKHQPLNDSISLDDESNTRALSLISAVNPEDMIVCRENIGLLRNIVETSLTASERGILNMYISGVSYAAIARVLHVSIKTVDNSLQKIKKKLLISVEG